MKRKILFSILVTFLFLTTACTAKDKKEDIAKEVITSILTVPYECWPSEEEMAPKEQEGFDDKKLVERPDVSKLMSGCLVSRLNGHSAISEEEILSSEIGATMLMLVMESENTGKTFKVKTLEVNQNSNDKNIYEYKAILTVGDDEQSASGSIQFNSDGKIDYFRLITR